MELGARDENRARRDGGKAKLLFECTAVCFLHCFLPLFVTPVKQLSLLTFGYSHHVTDTLSFDIMTAIVSPEAVVGTTIAFSYILFGEFQGEIRNS